MIGARFMPDLNPIRAIDNLGYFLNFMYWIFKFYSLSFMEFIFMVNTSIQIEL